MDSLMSENRQNGRDLGPAINVNNTLEVSLYPKGESGATFLPSVSEEGIISWTNDRNLINPTPRNIKGQAATIVVGDVTSGPIAAVTNVGDEHDAIFDFVMPEYGTAMTINGTEAGRTGSIYAPVTYGSTNQIIISQGVGNAPIWINKDYYTKIEIDEQQLIAGSNITITNRTISAKDTTYTDATTTAAGLMSKSDKIKLNGIESGATNTTIDDNLNSTSTTHGLSAKQGKILNDKFGGSQIVILTQAEYDALSSKDPTTLYFIKES